MSLKNQIIELREQGLSYDEIVEKLGCSKGTVSYHCGAGQKEKSLDRQRKNRMDNPMVKRIQLFKEGKRTGDSKEVAPSKIVSVRRAISEKVRAFQRHREANGKVKNTRDFNFTLQDFLEEFSETKICYLTGRPIDVNDPGTYHFDHIHPVALGGENTLDNLGLATREANFAKRDMTLEEFLLLCLDVVDYWGLLEE